MRRRILTLLAALCLPCLAAAQTDLAPNGGFEEVANDKPVQWVIGDKVSSLSTEQAHSGERSLKMVDSGKTIGSEIRSRFFAPEPGEAYLVSVWTYLVEGAPNGLGVYLESRDTAGKMLRDATEASCHQSAMVKGRWTQLQFVATPPADAAKVGVRMHTFSTAIVTCYVDDVSVQAVDVAALGPAVSWRGGTLDREHHQVWPRGLRWDHGASPQLALRFEKPADWTECSALGFRMHLDKPTKSTTMLIVLSENTETEGMDYYSTKIKLDWTGWRELTFPFAKLGKARKPLGWDQIGGVQFSASGWGQTLDPTTVVVLDGLEPVK